MTTDTSEADLYLETMPRRFWVDRLPVCGGGYGQLGPHGCRHIQQHGGFQQVLHVRMIGNPVHLDRSTTLTHTWSIGQAWATGGRGGTTLLSTLSASRTVGSAGTVQLSYDLMKQPVNYVRYGPAPRQLHDLPRRRHEGDLLPVRSTLLDAPYRSLTGDARYNFARRWQRRHVRERSADVVGKLPGLRGKSVAQHRPCANISITFSTLSHRFYFDMEASRF